MRTTGGPRYARTLLGAMTIAALTLGTAACHSSAKSGPARNVAPGSTVTEPGTPQDSTPQDAAATPGATSETSADGNASAPPTIAKPSPAGNTANPRAGAPSLPSAAGGTEPQEPVDPQRPEHTFPARQ